MCAIAFGKHSSEVAHFFDVIVELRLAELKRVIYVADGEIVVVIRIFRIIEDVHFVTVSEIV